MGSAKDVQIISKPRYNRLGTATFTFKDTYSVDDLVAGYGIKMANEIPGKGISLWRMSDFNFVNVQKGLAITHYIRSPTPGVMEVLAANVYKKHIRRGGEPVPGPKINVDFSYNIPSNATNFVIPLEVITRNEFGADSSIMRMYKKGEIKSGDIGLTSMSEDGRLNSPITTYTTKFEQGDQFLTRTQAMALSGLTPEQFSFMERMDLQVHNWIDQHTSDVGRHYNLKLVHPDGKREWIWNKDKPMLSDCFGTLDEDRIEVILEFENDIVKLSKQVLRDWNRGTDWYKNKFTPWKQIVDELHKKGVERRDWPEIEPAQAIPAELLKYVSDMYVVSSRMWTIEAKIEEAGSLIAQYRNLKQTGIIK